MKYVLDSNIGMKWLLEEDLSEKARSIRDEFSKGVHELLSPDVFLVEAAHALTMAGRQGRIIPTEVEAFANLPILSRVIRESILFLIRVFPIRDHRRHLRTDLLLPSLRPPRPLR